MTLAGPLDQPVLVRSRGPARKSGLLTERVLEIHHYTDKLFSFKTTRSASFRSSSGQGTLLLGNLNPGKRLVLMATGTGFAPFASILRDTETFESFDTVVIAYACRQADELEFATQTVIALHQHELLGPMIGGKLHYYAAVTREPFHRQGRIAGLIASGKLFADLKQTPLDVATDRVMICGNPDMTKDLRRMLIQMGFSEGRSNHPAEFVIEKAFVGS